MPRFNRPARPGRGHRVDDGRRHVDGVARDRSRVVQHGHIGPDRAADIEHLAKRPTIPASVAFADTRRRGDSVVRHGVIVGVQIEALDAVVRPDGSTEAGFPLPVGTDFFLVEDLFVADPASPSRG